LEIIIEKGKIIISDEDCYTIKMRGGKQQSGIYKVRLWYTHRDIPVFCDFDTDTGGWTVTLYYFFVVKIDIFL
jgi:hypothetical protein